MGFFHRSSKRNKHPKKQKAPVGEIVIRGRTKRRTNESHTRSRNVSPPKSSTRSPSCPSKSTELQRQHRESLYGLSHLLLEESKAASSSHQSHSSSESSPVPVSPPQEKRVQPVSQRPRPQGKTEKSSTLIPESSCNMLDMFSGMYLCGFENLMDNEPKKQSNKDDVEILREPIPNIPREISFSEPDQHSWQDDHVLLSEINEVASITRAPSLLERITRRKKRDHSLTRMKIYVEKPTRVPKLKRTTSADFSTLTGPTIALK